MSKLREKLAVLNKTAVDYKQMKEENAGEFDATWDTTFQELSKLATDAIPVLEGLVTALENSSYRSTLFELKQSFPEYTNLEGYNSSVEELLNSLKSAVFAAQDTKNEMDYEMSQ